MRGNTTVAGSEEEEVEMYESSAESRPADPEGRYAVLSRRQGSHEHTMGSIYIYSLCTAAIHCISTNYIIKYM